MEVVNLLYFDDRCDQIVTKTPPSKITQYKKPLEPFDSKGLLYGRDSGIRTHDPYTPSVVRYQTALCPDLCGAEYIERLALMQWLVFNSVRFFKRRC